MYQQKFKITNLTCPACKTLSVGVLEEIQGIKKVSVNLDNGLTEIESDRAIDWQEITKSLAEVDKIAEPIKE